MGEPPKRFPHARVHCRRPSGRNGWTTSLDESLATGRRPVVRRSGFGTQPKRSGWTTRWAKACWRCTLLHDGMRPLAAHHMAETGATRSTLLLHASRRRSR